MFEHELYGAAKDLLRDIFPYEDWDTDPHLDGTPSRFVRMLSDLQRVEEFSFTTFESNSDEMVTLKDIPFYSLCKHHVVPFFGKAHVSYVPQGKIVGLSKIPRAVRACAAGLQVQEELTADIADRLDVSLEPLGVGVVIEAEHLCMAMRGIQVPGVTTVTSCMKGVYLDPGRGARVEFLKLIGK